MLPPQRTFCCICPSNVRLRDTILRDKNREEHDKTVMIFIDCFETRLPDKLHMILGQSRSKEQHFGNERGEPRHRARTVTEQLLLTRKIALLHVIRGVCLGIGRESLSIVGLQKGTLSACSLIHLVVP
mmetsp:Transcript_40137/g.59510  ORF Transcript_40137/g.59510 Transcript_40137/m.59510 type:complete len:128 (+) Transcript_40137:848-1231(+)